jgi:hypothetical protein
MPASPKSRRSYPTVALNLVVADGLAAYIACSGTGDDRVVFDRSSGRPVVRAMVGKYLRPTADAAGLVDRTGATYATTTPRCSFREALARPLSLNLSVTT